MQYKIKSGYLELETPFDSIRNVANMLMDISKGATTQIVKEEVAKEKTLSTSILGNIDRKEKEFDQRIEEAKTFLSKIAEDSRSELSKEKRELEKIKQDITSFMSDFKIQKKSLAQKIETSLIEHIRKTLLKEAGKIEKSTIDNIEKEVSRIVSTTLTEEVKEEKKVEPKPEKKEETGKEVFMDGDIKGNLKSVKDIEKLKFPGNKDELI